MTTPPIATEQPVTHALCEFAHSPFINCYCYSITSQTVRDIVTYCMGENPECPVYQKRVVHN